MSALVLRLPDDTAALGAAVAAALGGRAGAVIGLKGPLGAGKTTLARGLLRALGVRGAIRSPTYTLLEPYEFGGELGREIVGAGRGLVHLDLYRLKDETELEPLGLRDYPPEHWWWLIEWPERAARRLPGADLVIALEHAATGRRAGLTGPLAGAVISRFTPG
ncbi:MAG: tRNA (adenosine(37)-N6)-threonylcarbamoyltransferase complex ATPase subunit type 1 TsaE [Gammaproteobacteria bacterium]